MEKSKKPVGSFSRIMSRGQQKVATTAQTKALLLALSEDDHKRIARVIRQWLTQDENTFRHK